MGKHFFVNFVHRKNTIYLCFLSPNWRSCQFTWF